MNDLYAQQLEAISRALTEADPLAPSPEAWISVGQRGCFAWQHPGRLAAATELMRVTNRVHGFAAVALYCPKDRNNVGHTLRAALCFGAAYVQVFGPERNGAAKRSHDPTKAAPDTQDAWKHLPLIVTEALLRPEKSSLVAVEIADDAQGLPSFAHPDAAVYAFGSEDGCLPDIGADHKLVIPSRFCLNLAAAVNIVLYDRIAKAALKGALP